MRGQSQFIEMFGERSTTPIKNFIQNSFPGDWGKEDNDGTGIKVIRTTNFTNFGKLNLTEVVTRSVEERKVKKKLIHKYDTILERSGGTNENPVGRVVLFEEEGKFLCNNFTQVLRFENIEPRYAFYALYYFYQTNKTEVRNMGSKTTGIQNLNMNMYLNIGIPDASMNEQQQFVAIAEQSDKSKFVGFKSQFIEMFYNDNFICEKLKEHIEVIRGVSYKPTDVRDAKDKDSSVILRSNNIFNGLINYDDIVFVDSTRVSEAQELSKGDIVMCGSNGSKNLVGKAAMITELPLHKTSFGAFCLGIRCKDTIHPMYLSSYFQTSIYRNKIEELGAGSNILNIKPDYINNMEIPIPRIEQQLKFVSIAEQADKSKYNEYKS